MVDVKKEIGDRNNDVTQMAYYMEKDVRVNVTPRTKRGTSSPDLVCFVFVPQVKILPLFKSQNKFEPMVGGQKLEMENILVYYVDEEAPTFTMQNLSGGIIAVIVVVVLVVVIGLVVLVSARISHFVFVQVLYELTGLVSCFLRSSSSESATGSGTTKLR